MNMRGLHVIAPMQHAPAPRRRHMIDSETSRIRHGLGESVSFPVGSRGLRSDASVHGLAATHTLDRLKAPRSSVMRNVLAFSASGAVTLRGHTASAALIAAVA